MQIPIMISRKSAPLAPFGKGAWGKGPIVQTSLGFVFDGCLGCNIPRIAAFFS